MFWVKLSIGIVLAGIILFIMAACKVAGKSDRHAEKSYQAMHRGDNNGNNKDE